MDVSVFRILASADAEQRKQAQDTIIQAFDDPDFASVLLETLKGNPGDEELATGLSLSLLEFLRRRIVRERSLDEIRCAYVKQSLFEVLWKVPYQQRKWLLECVKVMFRVFEAWEEEIDLCLRVLQENNDVADVCTAMAVIRLWLEGTYFTGKAREALGGFAGVFVPLLVRHLELALSASEINREAAIDFIRSGSAALASLIKTVGRLFEVDGFLAALELITKTLVLKDNSTQIARLKDAVVEDIRTWIFQYGSSSVAAYKGEFCRYFRDTIAQKLVECVFDGIAVAGVPLVVNSLLYLLLVLCQKNLQIEHVFCEHFLNTLLLKTALLTEEDRQTYHSVPEQYVEFCLLVDGDTLKPDVTRHTLAMIIRYMPPELVGHTLQYLMGVLATAKREGNVLVFEGAVFVLSALCLYHKTKIEMPDFFEFAVNELQSAPHQFVVVGLLALLMLNNAHHEECVKIALTYFVSSAKDPVVVCVAASLFNESFDNRCMQIPDGTKLPEIVAILLESASFVHHSSIGIMLQKLIASYPSEFNPFALDLIYKILQIWKDSVGEGEDDRASHLLCSIARIITEYPVDHELIQQVTKPLIEFCCEELRNYEHCSHKQLLDIIGCICEKISRPPPIFFESILGFLSEFIANENFSLLWFSQCKTIMCGLISRENFSEIPEVAETIVRLCDGGLDRWTHDDAANEILNTYIHLICRSKAYSSLISRGVLLLEKDVPNLVTAWAIALVSAAITATQGEALQFLSDSAFSKWMHFDISAYGQALTTISTQGLLTIATATGNIVPLCTACNQLISLFSEDESLEDDDVAVDWPVPNIVDLFRALVQNRPDMIQQLDPAIQSRVLAIVNESDHV